ncbi:MAG: 30S ribosomal protein S9 [Candidatus Hodgkinia cicadicola]
MYKVRYHSGFVVASGFKKTARALARLRPCSKPSFVVNNSQMTDKFSDPMCRGIVMSAFDAARCYKFDVEAKTFGGGVVAQAYALRSALVKCVLGLNPEMKRAFRRCGYVTTDCRAVERKKYGYAKARKSFQFSKR